MKINVPINARKSKSSLALWSVPLSRRRVQERLGLRQRRDYTYGASIALFVVMAGALVVNTVGGIVTDASAQEGRQNQLRWPNEWTQNFNTTQKELTPTADGKETGTPSKTEPVTPVVTTPVPKSPQVTQPDTAPAPITEQQQQVSPAPAEKPSPALPATPAPRAPSPARVYTYTPVVYPSAPVVESPVVNTAPAIEEMTAAQAIKATSPVTYSSSRISSATRDRLLATAGAATLASILMYVLTMHRGAQGANSLGLSMRSRIPVKEVTTS